MIELQAQPLTAEAFAPFGQVIDLACAEQLSINQGLTTRFHDLFDVDVANENGRPIVNVFRSQPLPLPHKVEIMERHPLGSQAFMPMDAEPFLVMVGLPKNTLTVDDLRLFVTNGKQGINFFRNTWHHYQMVLGQQRDFIVVDRGGAGENLQECRVEGEAIIPASVI